MATITLTGTYSAQPRAASPDSNYSGLQSYDLSLGPLLTQYPAPSSTYKYRKITTCRVMYYLRAGSGNAFRAALSAPEVAFTAATVTYNTAPALAPLYNVAQYDDDPQDVGRVAVNVGLDNRPYWLTLRPDPADVRRLLGNGVALGYISTPVSAAPLIAGTGDSSYKPKIELDLSDSNVSMSFDALSPGAGGYVDRAKSTRFSWSIGTADACYEVPTQTSATFKWRVGSGASTSINCGANAYCDVAANTFPAATDNLQWQVTVSLSSGGSITSPWTTFTTVDAVPSAVCVSPVSALISGDKDVILAWEHVISTGTAPTKSELQRSTDGTTWTTLATVTGSALTRTISAGTFSAGALYWRVRTYNSDAVAGDWSAPAVCTVISAPEAPSVSTTQTPRPTITWQAAGQQAAEIRIDGTIKGPIYGTGKVYVWPDYVADGAHTVGVRVQNAYGLWGSWGYAPLTVANTPGDPITLVADGGSSAYLEWTDVLADRYAIYRDGVPIANIRGTSYEDAYALGDVEYQVRATWGASDDYTLSNKARATVAVDCIQIAAVGRGSWVPLRLNTDQSAALSIYHSRTATLRHYVGQAYPSVEYTDQYDKQLSFSAAFRRDDAAGQRAMEALAGQTVCVKTPAGDRVIGTLRAIRTERTPLWTEYSCTVEQIEWSEEVRL